MTKNVAAGFVGGLGHLPRLLLLALLVAAFSAATGAQDPAAGPPQVRMPLAPTEQTRGSAAAPLTMVEFTDYQCPYCRRFQAEVWPRIKHDYVDTGRLLFIVRDLPLPFHAGAKPAAEAAHCAAEQGKFWPMHDALLAKGAELSAKGIEQHARALKLDVNRFDTCVASGKYAAAIEHNAAEADALGLRGTPAFVIGRVQQGQLVGWPIEGALPFDDFDAVLRQALAGD
jgi:protein-disulfide isomerase